MNVDLPQINVSLFRDVPPKPEVKVCVVVPAKNEAAGLTHTLDALRCQQDATGNAYPANTYEVLLLINNSNDGSYRVAKNYQQQYPEFQFAQALCQRGYRQEVIDGCGLLSLNHQG
jgi:glycosyltransferase involved in cell wall biosynthesis